jgi:ketol-acid reductoisomerase
VSGPPFPRRVAILGFGNQGAAHAELLRAEGCEVLVGAREGAGAERARHRGFEVHPLAEAAERGDAVAVLLPDEILPELWPSLLPSLRPGRALVFAHGFNLLYDGVSIPESCDAVLVSPTAPGHVLARARERDERVPAYVAVHHDATGGAWDFALEYARRLRCGPLWRTTVREETEVDLFGEQVVLCGGMNALVLAAFQTLTARGYTPEVAYLECVHQLRYLAELLQDRGLAGFREAISGTALYGDLTRGPRVIGPEARREMQRILDEIRDGRFAAEWRAEARAGRPRLRELLDDEAVRAIDAARRRALSGDPAPPRS